MFKFVRILLDEAGGEAGSGGGGGGLSFTPPATGTSATPPSKETVTPPVAAGTGGDEWYASLPAELKDNDNIKRFKSLKDLAAGYVSAHKMISGDKINVPTKHTTEEEWKGIHRKLGVPEKLEDYKLNLAADSGVSEEFKTGYTQMAHSLGILPSQAEKLLAWAGASSKTNMEASKNKFLQKQEQDLKALEQEWGAAYKTKIERASALLQQHAPESFARFANDAHLVKNVEFIKFLDNFSEKFFKEGTIVETPNQTVTLTPAQAQVEISRIMGDKKHAYFDKQHPAHKAAVDEMKGLFETLHPTAKEIKLRDAKRSAV